MEAQMNTPILVSPVPEAVADDRLALCWDEAVGLGVRLLSDCPAGAVLDRFSGEIGPELRQHSLQVAPGLHISGTRFIGYLTHGCAPNSWLDMARFELVALRGLAAGERLTIDYGETEDHLYRQFACLCGASQCRHWITGREDQVSDAGLAHLAALGRGIAAE
jgi:hypothetical protein